MMNFSLKKVLIAFLLTLTSIQAHAALTYWVDWQTGSTVNGYTAHGVITTSGSTVNVTYNNPQGIAFFQPSGGGDYWANSSGGRNDAVSPYTSSLVDNAPTGTDLIALRYAGSQTLTFSEAIANPVFSYVSLNGNGYGFNQDFDILSFGDASNGNACGYWGCGTSYKQVVDLGGGVMQYQLLGTGENSGTIRFKGAFNSVSWLSLSNEYWNGFTMGVQGTALEVPAPSAIWLLCAVALGLAVHGRRQAII